MSPRTTRVFQCLCCGQAQEVQVWETVNVSLHPKLKPKLLSGELFDFACKHCAHDAELQYPLLYHDMKRRAMFWLVPAGTRPGDAIGFPGPKGLYSGYILRLVRDFNELIEKILLLDAGIDDRLMELFKLHVRRHGHLAAYPRGTKLFFHGIDRDDQGQPQINLLVLEGDAETHLVTREDAYRAWEQRTKPLPPPTDQQDWLQIDQKYARRIARGRS